MYTYNLFLICIQYIGMVSLCRYECLSGCLYVQLVFDHTALFVCKGKRQEKKAFMKKKKWVNHALMMIHYD